ncbi:MAG: hypothetical protein AB7O96_09835 [Pseudobdellovibrionaceae bacterium]
MFSKVNSKKIVVYSILSIGLTVSGCGLKVGEKPDEKKPLPAPASELKCLSKTTPVFKKFFQAEATEQEIDAFWTCAQKALEAYQKSVRGSKSDSYKDKEIGQFVELYFLDEQTKIPSSFMVEVMKLKQLLVGGNESMISQEELGKLISVLDELRAVSQKIRPYVKYYGLKAWPADESVSPGAFEDKGLKIDEAAQALKESAAGLAVIFSRYGTSYEFSSLESLALEIEKMYGGQWSFAAGLGKFLPSIAELKVSVTGGNHKMVASQEWPRFFDFGVMGYSQYLRFHYLWPQAKQDQKQFIFLTDIALRGIKNISSLIAGKPEQKLTKEEIERTCLALGAVWTDLKISNELLAALFKIKVLFLAGTEQEWTHAEMERAHVKISQASAAIKNMSPYWTLYGLTWKKAGSAEQDQLFVGQGIAQLQESLIKVASLAEGPYDLNEAGTLVREIQKRIQDGKESQDKNSFLSIVVPLAGDVKRISSQSRSTTIEAEEWKPFVDLIGASAEVYLRIHYTESLGLKDYIKLADSFLEKMIHNFESNHVRGLHRQDLNALLEKVGEISKTATIQAELLNLAMEIKKFLFGGRVDFISTEELKSIRTQIPRWIALYEQVKPELRLLLAKDRGPLRADQYLKIASSFDRALAELILLLPEQIDLNEVKALLLRSGIVNSTDFNEKYSLFLEVKKHFTGNQSATLTRKDLIRLRPLVKKTFTFLAAKTQAQVKLSFQDLEGLKGLYETLVAATPIVEDLLESQPGKRLGEKALLELIDMAKDQGWISPELGEKLTNEIVIATFRFLLNRILLSPEARLDGVVLDSMGIEEWNKILKELEAFITLEEALEKPFARGEEKVPRAEILKSLVALEKSNSAVRKDSEKLRSYLSVPYGSNKEGAVYLNIGLAELYKKEDVIRTNLLGTVLKWFIRGYSRDLKRAKAITSIRESELRTIIKDVKPFMKFFGSTFELNNKFISKRLIEASLFPRRANGRKDPLKAEVAFDYATLILSGMKLKSEFIERYTRNCPVDRRDENNLKFETDCLIRETHAQFYVGVDSMPRFAGFILPFDRKEFRRFFGVMANAADIDLRKDTVSEKDFFLVPHIMQFVESILIRFDKNVNGSLSTQEAIKAYPVYKQLLSDVSCFKEDKWLLPLFTYLLNYGEPPESSLGGGIRLFIWKQKGPNNWNLRVDRYQLIRILAEIATRVSKSSGSGDSCEDSKVLDVPIPTETQVKEVPIEDGLESPLH